MAIQHFAIDGTVTKARALLKMIARGELIRVAVLIVIGVALIALALVRQPPTQATVRA
jgi:hypothetical protein